MNKYSFVMSAVAVLLALFAVVWSLTMSDSSTQIVVFDEPESQPPKVRLGDYMMVCGSGFVEGEVVKFYMRGVQLFPAEPSYAIALEDGHIWVGLTVPTDLNIELGYMYALTAKGNKGSEASYPVIVIGEDWIK